MTEERTVKADFHGHPSFWNPQSGKRVPHLRSILEHLFRNHIVIAPISACHAKSEYIDYRFFDYMKQRNEVEDAFLTDYDIKRGVLYVARRKPIQGEPEKVIVVHSQEVRTDYKGMPADINIIGVNRIIQPEKGIDETTDEARGEGGLCFICHATSQCGAGLDKALEMLEDGKALVEEYDATASEKANQELVNALRSKEKKGVAVSDAHYYNQIGKSFCLFSPSILQFNSTEQLIENLGRRIEAQDFDNYEMPLGFFPKFWHHERHILLSIPGHLIRNPRWIINVLGRRKD